MESIKNKNKNHYQEEALIKKNIDIYNDREIQLIQQNCLEMGFDLNMVNKIIFYYNIRREAEIIDYLIKNENGMWSHPFIPMVSKDNERKDNNILSNRLLNNNNKIMNNVISRMNSFNSIKDNIIQNNKDICEICGDSKEFHLIQKYNINNNSLLSLDSKINIYDKRNSENSNIILYGKENEDEDDANRIDNDNIININKKAENKNVCPICLDEFENPIEIEDCKHKLCQECFNLYITDLITKNNIDNIPCPYKNCQNKSISEEFFAKYISERTYFKYCEFKSQNEIARDPNKLFCPYCNSFAIIEDELEKYNTNSPNYIKSTLKCQNEHEFCSCGRPLHMGDCYKENQEFINLMKKEHIKKCPKCGFLIKKNKGCNHMTCGNPLCKYEFCWICMKESIPDHFKYGPCAGMQFIDPDSIVFKIKNNYPKIYCIYSIFSCLYNIFIFILSLFICPSISLIYLTYKIMFNGNRNYIIPRKYCIHIIYFISASCVYISSQSIIYMIWMIILTIIFIIIFCCLLKCFMKIILGNKKKRDVNEVEFENINNVLRNANL